MNRFWSTRNTVLMGMLGALAGLLMLFEFPLLFLAPEFYKLDISEVPVLIGSYALGPAAGVVIEGVKIAVKLLLKPTSTGYVGELANFAVGCSLVLPAGLIYRHRKTKKTAAVSLALGTVSMTAVSIAVNALVMLPFYSKFMPMEAILTAGAAIHPAIGSVWGFALLCVGPFNLAKGILVSMITMLIYKKVSFLIRSFQAGGGHGKNH